MRRWLVILMSAALLLPCPAVLAQNYRFSYMFYSRKEPGGGLYATDMNMRLDLYGREGFFYSESKFFRDSLSNIAFDPKSGGIADEAAYAELTRLSSHDSDMMTDVDYGHGKFTQNYHIINMFLSGSGELDMPEWTVTDETDTVCGYPARKAEGDYFGRHWTVWYTEDIPVNAGPWLLWGAPGLIVYAVDSEKMFYFKLFGAKPLEDAGRMEFLRSLYTEKKPRKKYFRYPVGEIEKMFVNLMTDEEYFGQLTGSRLEKVVDRNGNDKTAEYLESLKYTPLIPLTYWNDR